MSKIAFLSGITGMDGSHLADILIAKGWEVHGLMRRNSTQSTWRIEHILDNLTLHTGDLTDQASLEKALREARPTHIWHLGAQSFVGASFDCPIATIEVTGLGTLRLLEAIRAVCPEARTYIASSSEMVGVTETTDRFDPVSPYGAAKVLSHQIAGIYRNAYSMWIARAINYNHESERRGEEFVTRKITRAIGRAKAGQMRIQLKLGNLDAVRDWSYAPEVMDLAYEFMMAEEPLDYVVGSGKGHSVKQFLDLALQVAGPLEDRLEVLVDDSQRRPLDIPRLIANPPTHPTHIPFETLVERMVEADIERARA